MLGIYFEVSTPIVQTENYLFTIQKFNSYGHNIAALGGFWDASIGLSVGQQVAEDWYENGLGRRVHVKNHNGGTVWRGFVDKITITAGSQTITRGPLLEIANRVSATYTPRDFSVYPPVDGSTTVTTLQDDTGSQELYGIFEQSVAAGATSQDIAEKTRDAFLRQYKLPKTSGDFSISGVGSPLSLTLDLLGNVHWYKVYPYNNFTAAVITAYDKLIQVLTANTTINPYALSSVYSYIDANAYAMEQIENKNRYAWDIINEIVSIGDASTDTRRIFGVYEEDKAHYENIPDYISYEYRLGAQRQAVRDFNTYAIVYPWDVRPGKWINVPDWLISKSLNYPAQLIDDQRNKFIENVNFSAPYTVGLTGSPFDTLSQMISKITYTGGIY